MSAKGIRTQGQQRVMISSGAKVLGPPAVGDTAYSRRSGGAEEVPPTAWWSAFRARVVGSNGQKIRPLDQIHVPDLVSQQLCALNFKANELTKKLEALDERNRRH